MDHENFLEFATSIVFMFTMPYWLGIPITIVWVAIAWSVMRLTGWRGLLPAVVVMSWLISPMAAAHDWTHPDFAQLNQYQRNWLQKQRRPFTNHTCCNEADSEQVDEEIRYDSKGVGRYWIWSKHTRGQWMQVPEEAIIREPNMHGRPVAWFRWVSHDGSTASVPRSDMTPVIFCYAPGPLL